MDDIIQTTFDQRGKVNIAFTLAGAEAGAAQAMAELIGQRFGAESVEVDDDLARVSVVGVGMRSHSGVAAKLFNALALESIPIENISTSEIVISVLIRRADADRALKAAHRAFVESGAIGM